MLFKFLYVHAKMPLYYQNFKISHLMLSCSSKVQFHKTSPTFVLFSNPSLQTILFILLFYVLTLKYMCHFGMNLKELNPRTKDNIKYIISWLIFSAHSLVLSYLLICLGKYVGM